MMNSIRKCYQSILTMRRIRNTYADKSAKLHSDREYTSKPMTDHLCDTSVKFDVQPLLKKIHEKTGTWFSTLDIMNCFEFMSNYDTDFVADFVIETLMLSKIAMSHEELSASLEFADKTKKVVERYIKAEKNIAESEFDNPGSYYVVLDDQISNLLSELTILMSDELRNAFGSLVYHDGDIQQLSPKRQLLVICAWKRIKHMTLFHHNSQCYIYALPKNRFLRFFSLKDPSVCEEMREFLSESSLTQDYFAILASLINKRIFTNAHLFTIDKSNVLNLMELIYKIDPDFDL